MGCVHSSGGEPVQAAARGGGRLAKTGHVVSESTGHAHKATSSREMLMLSRVTKHTVNVGEPGTLQSLRRACSTGARQVQKQAGAGMRYSHTGSVPLDQAAAVSASLPVCAPPACSVAVVSQQESALASSLQDHKPLPVKSSLPAKGGSSSSGAGTHPVQVQVQVQEGQHVQLTDASPSNASPSAPRPFATMPSMSLFDPAASGDISHTESVDSSQRSLGGSLSSCSPASGSPQPPAALNATSTPAPPPPNLPKLRRLPYSRNSLGTVLSPIKEGTPPHPGASSQQGRSLFTQAVTNNAAAASLAGSGVLHLSQAHSDSEAAPAQQGSSGSTSNQAPHSAPTVYQPQDGVPGRQRSTSIADSVGTSDTSVALRSGSALPAQGGLPAHGSGPETAVKLSAQQRGLQALAHNLGCPALSDPSLQPWGGAAGVPLAAPYHEGRPSAGRMVRVQAHNNAQAQQMMLVPSMASTDPGAVARKCSSYNGAPRTASASMHCPPSGATPPGMPVQQYAAPAWGLAHRGGAVGIDHHRAEQMHLDPSPGVLDAATALSGMPLYSQQKPYLMMAQAVGGPPLAWQALPTSAPLYVYAAHHQPCFHPAQHPVHSTTSPDFTGMSGAHAPDTGPTSEHAMGGASMPGYRVMRRSRSSAGGLHHDAGSSQSGAHPLNCPAPQTKMQAALLARRREQEQEMALRLQQQQQRQAAVAHG